MTFWPCPTSAARVAKACIALKPRPNAKSAYEMASQSRVETRLREREESRKAALEQKKAEREAGQRQEETADYYLHEFARKKTTIS